MNLQCLAPRISEGWKSKIHMSTRLVSPEKESVSFFFYFWGDDGNLQHAPLTSRHSTLISDMLTGVFSQVFN